MAIKSQLRGHLLQGDFCNADHSIFLMLTFRSCCLAALKRPSGAGLGMAGSLSFNSRQRNHFLSAFF